MKCKNKIKRINCFKSWEDVNKWNNNGYQIKKKHNMNRLFKDSKKEISIKL